MVSHERLERRFADIRKIAQFRSGARGWNARKIEIETEAEFAKSKERLEEDLSQLDAATLSAETKSAIDLLSEVQLALDMVMDYPI
jgi:ATP-binding cassette subfamily F protein 3